MTIYDDAKASLATIHQDVDAFGTLITANAVLAPLAADQASIGSAVSAAGAHLAGITPPPLKPLPVGLWSRDNPVAQHIYDAAYPGYIARGNWADLEPTRGSYQPAVLDRIRQAATARGKVTALRLYTGNEAPAWAKALGGPIRIYNPLDKVWGTVGAWWDSRYQTAFGELLDWVASEIDNDHLFVMVCDSLGGMIYPEPFLRSIGDNTTHANLAAAGLTTAKDHAALVWAANAYAQRFKRTRTFLSFNPGQNFDTRQQDPSWSDAMVATFRHTLGARGVFYSTSLNDQASKAPADQELYQQFVSAGGPRAIQTVQNGRVGSWSGMMSYGISLGFHMVETEPGGWEQMQTVAQAEAYSAKLAANAKALA